MGTVTIFLNSTMGTKEDSSAALAADAALEDDEFEEFPKEEWDEKEVDKEDENQWEDNWEDDNLEDDFSVQLRAELVKAGTVKACKKMKLIVFSLLFHIT